MIWGARHHTAFPSLGFSKACRPTSPPTSLPPSGSRVLMILKGGSSRSWQSRDLRQTRVTTCRRMLCPGWEGGWAGGMELGKRLGDDSVPNDWGPWILWKCQRIPKSYHLRLHHQGARLKQPTLKEQEQKMISTSIVVVSHVPTNIASNIIQ